MNFSNSQIVDYVQRAIRDRSGDDLERARACFRGFTAEEMQQPHGESGQTRQQVLDGYVNERALATAAMKWVVDHAWTS